MGLGGKFASLLKLQCSGEVSERFKEHAWKACVGETQPWVQIPPSPPNFQEYEKPNENRKRVFYYSSLVEDLADASLVEQDRHTLPEVVYTPAELLGDEVETDGKTPIPRSSSISYFLRKEAKLGKTPRELLESCVKSLKQGEIKKHPKNLFILFCMLKEQYLAVDKRYKNWREVKKAMPKDHVMLEDVFACAKKAGLEIPNYTPDELLSRDGRSRENRSKKNR